MDDQAKFGVPTATLTYGDSISFDSFDDMVAMRPSGVVSPWYWLSFTDPDLPKGSQFLGVAIVRAGAFLGAVSAASALGINPGGEVKGLPIPDEHVPPEQLRNRLLSRTDLVEAGL